MIVLSVAIGLPATYDGIVSYTTGRTTNTRRFVTGLLGGIGLVWLTACY